jgi:hypothetical protein
MLRTIIAVLLVGTAVSGEDQPPSLIIKPRAHPPLQVKNRPLEAQFEVSDTAGSQVVHGTIYRDSSGRVRTEHAFSTGEHMTIISDPVAGEAVVLDDVAREASRGASSEPLRTGWAFADCIPSFTDEYKIIEGVRCRRTILKDARDRSDAGETWLSDDLMVVFADTQSSGGIQRRWRITHLVFKEPRAELFSVPADYTSVEVK